VVALAEEVERKEKREERREKREERREKREERRESAYFSLLSSLFFS
jgi:hypothetical protein